MDAKEDRRGGYCAGIFECDQEVFAPSPNLGGALPDGAISESDFALAFENLRVGDDNIHNAAI